MIRIFIGYDPRESVAYHVLAHSIIRRASRPLSIAPLALQSLGDLLQRKRDPLQSTDFAFSRFLVPHLSGYEGWSVFMDCDMLCLGDVAKLFEERDEGYAVQCVKHEYHPTELRKFLGQPQTAYAKKNWSSVMLFNNAACRKLTPEYISAASGLALHQFQWMPEPFVGPLPARWNHLVGYDDPRDNPALLHYTTGGPWFKEYAHCAYSGAWRLEQAHMLGEAL